MFTGVDTQAIALLPNAKTVYEVPITLESAGIGRYVVDYFGLKSSRTNLRSWRWVVNQALKTHDHTVKVGVVAKYLDNEDTYMSVFEALKSAAFSNGVGLEIVWIDSERLASGRLPSVIDQVDGLLVPGGFGKRGLEGKIRAAKYAAEQNIPYLGLCLGMQVAVVAAARQAGLKQANTIEVDENTAHPVIHIMPGQKDLWGTGGTMRLGDYPCRLTPGSLARKLYGKNQITERHRHRYEVNNQYRNQLEAAGLKLSGVSPDGQLVEVVERPDHPFFIASQFHPEFKSRPNRPHPMFSGFISSLKKRTN